MKKILVLTSGGDSSGMNAYIKALAKLCKQNDVKLFASLYGYKGLVQDMVVPLFYDNLADIENLGGSVIKTSRCPEFVEEEGFNKALATIKKHKIDCVVVVGGNGSFNGANRLCQNGVNVLAIPGTIDNDLEYTDKTLGYDTACQNALDDIIKIKQTMQASDRGAIVQVMGRHCPDIALHCAILANANLAVTKPMSNQQILQKVANIIASGNPSPVVVVQENILDVNQLALFLQTNLGKEFRASTLGYVQRGGEPTANDKLLAIQLACSTIKKVLGNVFGYAIGYKDGAVTSKLLCEVVAQTKQPNQALQNLYNQYCDKF